MTLNDDDVSQGTEYRWYLESMPVTNEPDIRRILDGIDARDAEIVRLSREKARLALENDRLASSLVEIQEAVADAHGQLTDDGLIDDDYDTLEGVRLLRVQRDNASEAEEMHGRHWDQECEENARLKRALLGLLQSSDANWEEQNLGHDWADAVAYARDVLGIHPGGA